MSSLNILSGGAAQGLVGSLAPAFKAPDRPRHRRASSARSASWPTNCARAYAGRHRHPDRGTSSQSLRRRSWSVAASISDVGLVETALAVRAGDPPVTRQRCRRPARARCWPPDAIFVPDTKASTAGIHVAKVIGAARHRRRSRRPAQDFPERRDRDARTGGDRMRGVRSAARNRPKSSAPDGVTLSGSLPPGCELATMYTAGITAQAAARATGSGPDRPADRRRAAGTARARRLHQRPK